MKFSTLFQNFFKGLTDEGTKITLSPFPHSRLHYPGKLITFTYNTFDSLIGEVERIVFLVVNDTGKTTYISTRKKKLVTGFEVDDVSPEILAFILKQLYNNENMAQRHIVEALGTIIGMKRYRSYDMTKIFNIQELKLDLTEVK